MNIRYFFIASAVTSSLALAIQESDSIVNQQPSPIVTNYTVDDTGLQFIKPVGNTLDKLDILKIQDDAETEVVDSQNLYQKSKELLHVLGGLIYNFFVFCIQVFLLGSGNGIIGGS
ncbi:hypothetical protein V4B17_05905 [Bartonella sp. B23]